MNFEKNHVFLPFILIRIALAANHSKCLSSEKSLNADISHFCENGIFQCQTNICQVMYTNEQDSLLDEFRLY